MNQHRLLDFKMTWCRFTYIFTHIQYINKFKLRKVLLTFFITHNLWNWHFNILLWKISFIFLTTLKGSNPMSFLPLSIHKCPSIICLPDCVSFIIDSELLWLPYELLHLSLIWKEKPCHCLMLCCLILISILL